VPVLIDGDRWVLGFDSGIARGGVAVYDAVAGRWSFVFLRAGGYRYAQFTSITKFGDYYVGCLGYPTAIVVSKDLVYWHLLYLDKTSARYNHLVNAVAQGDRVVAVTGGELLVYDPKDIEKAFKGRPFLAPYKAYLDRARGFAYVIKRLPWLLRL